MSNTDNSSTNSPIPNNSTNTSGIPNVAPATSKNSLKGFNTILKDNAIFQQQYLSLVGKAHLIRLPTRLKTLPPNFDGRIVWKDYLTPVKSQGHCGACWAFATCATFSMRHNIATNNNPRIELSPANMITCDTGEQEFSIVKAATEAGSSGAKAMEEAGQKVIADMYGCLGSTLIASWQFLFSDGCVEESCVPYNDPQLELEDWTDSTNIPSCEAITGAKYNYCLDGIKPARYWQASGLYYVPGTTEFKGSERNIRVEIYKWGPVSSGIVLHDDFLDWDGKGIYQYDGKSPEKGGHSIVIIGWGEEEQGGTKYWICQNSWGSHWGEDGYFRIRRGTNECKIEENVIVGFPDMLNIAPHLDYPILNSETSWYLRGIYSGTGSGYTNSTENGYYRGEYPNLDMYYQYNETNTPQWNKYIAAELDSRKYYSKERRYNERVCGWKWKCFLAVLISAILVVAGYYAYRKWWKSKK
jgi:Papain family cysteine protease